jgi:hypothetical protein
MRYKNLFSFGARMLFLAPNGCKGSYFLRYLSIKKEKSEKKVWCIQKIYVPLQPQIRKWLIDCPMALVRQFCDLKNVGSVAQLD